MNDLIVTRRHLWTIPQRDGKRGYCRPKSRLWFERHGLSWSDFKRQGIAAQVLLDTGCGMAARLVAWARTCEAEAARDGE